MEQKRVFLIQSSGKPAQHITVEFPDRTYADEVLKHGYYRNELWDVKARDQDFGKCRVGDYVLHYCTGDVEDCTAQIKYIYEIAAVEKIESDIDNALNNGRISKDQADQLRKNPHVLRLKLHVALNRGLELAQIRKWVQEGKLSPAMNNCGKLGFNICEVDVKDYETIIEWNKTQPLTPSTQLSALLEEDLRHYIVNLSSLEAVLGSEYKGYRLYREPDGQITGELYDTKVVGQIDLLYQNENGDFLVIELKRTEDTSDKAVGQIARYIGWVQENLAKGKKVEGILIARSASEELKYAVKALKNCKLFTYEIQFKFTPI
jgi:hypothetical protein